MPIKPMVWPQGKACAAMISINLDAEYFARIYYPDLDVQQGDMRRLGESGIRFGLPRILDTLDTYGVKATFFIPGAVAQGYPDAVCEIARRGHEIGCRGMAHEVLANLSVHAQRQCLSEARDCLTALIGKAPLGFRMPEGEITEETLIVARALGFTYSSSLSDDDTPYVRQPAGLMELPVHWELFDLPYFAFTFDPPIPPGQARSAAMDDVLGNWLLELQGARRWGTLMCLQLDPQATGEQGRIFMLERLLEEIARAGDIWLATGCEIAAHCAGQLK